VAVAFETLVYVPAGIQRNRNLHPAVVGRVA
jgi:hypothetical protein